MTAQASEALTGLNKEIERLKSRVARLETLRDIIPWHLAMDDAAVPAVMRVIDHATRAFGESETVWTWLCTPQFRFDDRSPLDAAVTGDVERVEQLIGAIEYGVYL